VSHLKNIDEEGHNSTYFHPKPKKEFSVFIPTSETQDGPANLIGLTESRDSSIVDL
jgi:hypothetical protein